VTLTSTLLISEIFPPRHGGSGRWFAELYGRLPRDDYLVAAGATDGDAAVDASLADRLQIVRLPLASESWGLRSLRGLSFYLRSYRALAKLVRSAGITQVHCGRCLPEGVLGWLLSLRFSLPFLCYVHGEDIQTAAESRELTWIIQRVFSRTVRLIANSENTARLLVTDWKVPEHKVTVLHPGMDANRFVPATTDDAVPEDMGWEDRPVILTVGRLQRRKGQDMLIRALPALLKNHPRLLYAIVGDGEERERLVALVAELGLNEHVSFLGEVDDATMIRCYQQCTLFALPNRTEGSDIEGFGMVLAEAQACGKPVLAGDSGGTRETMLVGTSGVIADCTDPAPLAKALDDMLSLGPDTLLAMGQRGREHVCRALDWPVHVKKAQEVFGSLGAGSDKLTP
jgi:phosphatidylinositol alpha-1,6-mannosyltransferase